jgi:Zn-dependent M28 family amino/carboxypeptidase
MRFTLTLYALFIVAIAFSQDLAKDKTIKKVMELPDKEAIKSRIKYLADDKLLGRKPGTPGYQMAVDYVIDQFNQLGIEPKGDEGYLQKVVLRTARVDTVKSAFSWNDKLLTYGRDVLIMPNMNLAESSAEGQVVFVGMGISAPHLGYAGIDVNGKIVIMIPEVPSHFSDMEKAHFSNMALRADAAAARGAIGAIALMSNMQRYKAEYEGSARGTQGIMNKNGSVSAGRVPNNLNMKFYAVGSDTFFKTLIQNIKKGDVIGKVSVNSASIFSDLLSYNVVGWIPGTDAKLKNEFVVHSAHLDHLGVRSKAKGDSIYNGAHDNASGVACALEIAKLYKQVKLKRSVLIVIVTAEEMGLLGSKYFATNPSVKKSSMVANINTDMPTLLAPLLSIVPHGASSSSLTNEVNQAAAYLNLEVQKDWEPEQRRIVRSDQYSFIREGIPALAIKPGLKTTDPSIDMKKKITDWIRDHYHKLSDEYREDAFDWDGAITYVRLNFLVGYQVANTKKRPTWNKGDFFGETFGPLAK